MEDNWSSIQWDKLREFRLTFLTRGAIKGLLHAIPDWTLNNGCSKVIENRLDETAGAQEGNIAIFEILFLFLYQQKTSAIDLP